MAMRELTDLELCQVVQGTSDDRTAAMSELIRRHGGEWAASTASALALGRDVASIGAVVTTGAWRAAGVFGRGETSGSFADYASWWIQREVARIGP